MTMPQRRAEPDLVEVDTTVPEGSSTDLVEAPAPTTFADLSIAGLHGVEPDFSTNGVWVGPRLQIPLALAEPQRISIFGVHFPDIFLGQSGDPAIGLRVFVGAAEVHVASITANGSFEISFDAPQQGVDVPRLLTIESDRYFVPAQLGESSDQRELCWRWTRLVVGPLVAFDCRRHLNFLIDAESAPAEDGHDGSLRFHLDVPWSGMPDEREGVFAVSGWAFDLGQLERVQIRLMAGGYRHRTETVERADVQRAFGHVRGMPSATGFAAWVGAPAGVLPFQVQALSRDGRWVMVRRGVAISAGARPPGRPSRASAALRRFGAVLGRTGRSTKESAKHLVSPLPDTYRFHLDAPAVDKPKWVTTRCQVSGWTFDEEGPTILAVRVVAGDRIYRADSRHREDVQKAFSHLDDMPLSTGFACTMRLPIGIHELSIEVQRRDGIWIPVRSATVVRYPDFLLKDRAAPQLNFRSYSRRRLEYERHWRREAERHVSVMPLKPKFAIVVSGGPGPLQRETLRSLREQIYPFHTTVVPDGAAEPARWSLDGTRRAAPQFGTDPGDYVVFLRGGQTLEPTALYEFARAINREPDADLVYGDETVQLKGEVEEAPFYKPAWSPDYLETFDYVGAASCFRAAIVADCLDDLACVHHYDVALRFAERTARIVHVDSILGHDPDRLSDGSSVREDADRALDVRALQGRLTRTGRSGTVRELESHPGCYAIRLELARAPVVSIVIPTAGKTIALGARTIDLVVNVVEHIRHRSSYSNVEIVIVDNGDLTPEQIAFLRGSGCILVTYREPTFNIAKKLNLGVRHARGEFVILLNDDIEVVREDWIERMLEQFEKRHVGVVGGKLLYPDGRTQHVGVVHNSGNPDHVRRLFPRGDAGYFFSTCGVRNYAAVTGACMMTPAEVYRTVGGYSEELAVSYNDADFCLKVQSLGRTVVYAPEVELTHMESQSRVASADMHEVMWYQERWAPEIVSDPYYNERFLSVASPTFVPCINERLV